MDLTLTPGVVDVVIAANAPFNLNALLTHWNVVLIIGVWTVVQAIKVAMNGALSEGKPLARLFPLLPLALCQGAMWIPGPWMSADQTWGQRVVLGLFLGALTANLHTIASRLGLHKVLRIEPDPKKRVTATVRRRTTTSRSLRSMFKRLKPGEVTKPGLAAPGGTVAPVAVTVETNVEKKGGT